MSREIFEMCNLQYLPLDKSSVTAHYEGSIDKYGGNADWNWELYKESCKNEWVIFECLMPGCILNFVQHRFIMSSEVTFRFYFDGEQKPRFEIKPQEFGEKYPFLEPIASKFIARENQCEPVKYTDSIRVVRSFVPMPFAKSCKITSSLPLMNYSIPEGGWGHVVYHTYSDDRPVETFNPENKEYLNLMRLWSNSGRAPIKSQSRSTLANIVLRPQERKNIFSDDAPGMITAIKCITNKYSREHLKDIKFYATWDNHECCDVETNFGALFGNELGLNRTAYMLAGEDTNGEYYCYYPMPYLKNASIEIQNSSNCDIEFLLISISTTKEYNDLYKNNKFGYFSSSEYYERKCTHAADSIIADIKGSGHIISSVVTAYGIMTEQEKGDNKYACCEGDVRIHFNGIRTPQIESDGSESYACYGWGFCQPPQCNPVSGYDGFNAPIHGSEMWSMCRHLLGDWYTYRSGFRFGIESGGANDLDMEHSGAVFFYNTGAGEEYVIGEISFESDKNETAVIYSRLDDAELVTETSFFEGDNDDVEVTLSGYYGGKGSKLIISPQKDTDQIILRRVSNQKMCRQLADVYVDNEKIDDYPWYFPDHNPYKSWLEDEYIIPKKYIGSKEKIEVKIIPQECGGQIYFNEFGYIILGVRL